MCTVHRTMCMCGETQSRSLIEIPFVNLCQFKLLVYMKLVAYINRWKRVFVQESNVTENLDGIREREPCLICTKEDQQTTTKTISLQCLYIVLFCVL